jgi:hypothetical protein
VAVGRGFYKAIKISKCVLVLDGNEENVSRIGSSHRDVQHTGRGWRLIDQSIGSPPTCWFLQQIVCSRGLGAVHVDGQLAEIQPMRATLWGPKSILRCG